MGKLTDKVAKGVFWVLLEKFGVQAVHFVVTLVLARLLTPDDYGTVALLSIFIDIANVFVDSGFGKALVQKKKATQTDYDTVFYLSVTIALVLYAILFFAAPFVARFYNIPDLCIMMRILAISLIFHSINGVQNVELNRNMLFHLSFRISWVRVIVSSATGVLLAILGYGPWALVYSSFLGGIAGVIARQLIVRWRPTLSFSWGSATELFRFGWRVLAVSLIDRGYSNLQGLLIGKFYNKADLAYVNKGRHIPNLTANLVADTLRRVSFPALAKMQDDLPRLRSAMRRLIRVASFFVFPIMTALGVLGNPIVELLFGERWLPTVPYLQIMCFSVVLRQADIVNRQAIMAMGRSDIALLITFVRRLLCIMIMVFTLRLGVVIFFASVCVTVVPLGFFMNAIPNHILLRYTIKMQLSDMVAPLWCSLVSGGIVLATMAIPLPPMWMMPVQAVLFFAVYVTLAVVFRTKATKEVFGVLLSIAKEKARQRTALIAFLQRIAGDEGTGGAKTEE